MKHNLYNDFRVSCSSFSYALPLEMENLFFAFVPRKEEKVAKKPRRKGETCYVKRQIFRRIDEDIFVRCAHAEQHENALHNFMQDLRYV